MVQAGIWIGMVPPNPQPDETGSAEFGLFDYWLNNPSNEPMKDLAWLWKWLVGLPTTQIDAANYAALTSAVQTDKPGLMASDGSWVSESQYGALDPGWIVAFTKYFVTYFKGSFAPFTQNPATVALKGASSSQVVIALVSDFGTGNYTGGPAASVMTAISNLKPKLDYIIHLGDVYYYGSGEEEKSNLVQMWPTGYLGKSFTLNSNHEMYSGAIGYYNAALTDTIFSAQTGTSYFALQYGGWTIVGLDSAYWSSSPLIMSGSIESSDGKPGAMAQTAFLRGLGLSPQNTIVLSHHNPITYDGLALVTDDFGDNLWAQVTGALNGAPAAWYWGHVHNGIVYPNPNSQLGNTYGRCVGHGALPFGNAWGLEASATPAPKVQCYANTPNPNAPKPYPWMMNGFAILTITSAGVVTEMFYDQDGNVAPWAPSPPISYSLGRAA